MSDEEEVRDETETPENGPSRKRGCFWLFLVILVVAIVLWLIQPVETGVGEMSRFETARIYLHLALVEKPEGFDPLNGTCIKAYGNNIYKSVVGYVLLPSYGVALLNTWLEGQVSGIKNQSDDVPTLSEAWDLLEPTYEKQLEEMVPGEPVPLRGDMCHLPKVSTWTQHLLP
jgi:hypothetical protein